MTAGWLERLLASIVDRGKAWIRISPDLAPLERAIELARLLTSEKGEASGAALASALVTAYGSLSEHEKRQFLTYLANEFAPDEGMLRIAAEEYLSSPSPATAAALGDAAEPPRQELLRRWNLASNGTETLVSMRRDVLKLRRAEPAVEPLESDLRHLLGSWFNRGFLELRRIDWHTPAAILEKLILYEAVHEITGWDDLRRRLADDRRCFAFFHPALTDEPLIFVEVALVNGLAAAIEPLLRPADNHGANPPDTAIFYSISNCQAGLQGISFGNFLIKQVVEELKMEIPSLIRFATLSPVPGFRPWLERRWAAEDGDFSALREALGQFEADPIAFSSVETQVALRRLCAEFLTMSHRSKGPEDSVARFHLRNGARLERINTRGNISRRGMEQSYGLMVNYLYDPQQIEANHERFVRSGEVASAPEVAALTKGDPAGGGYFGSLLNRGGIRRQQRVDARVGEDNLLN